MNKIVYFLHVSFLDEFRCPLVSAKIEAWDHGPVFREIYHQFKEFGRENVRRYAKRLDPQTGAYVEVKNTLTSNEASFLRDRCEELLRIPAGKLVDMSHVKDGPWHRARFGSGRVNPGMEITEDLIREVSAAESRH